MHGVTVTLLEKRATLNTASRASTFHSPTLEILAELGVIGPMLAKGAMIDAIQYRTREEGIVAQFPMSLLSDETRFPHRLHLEQAAVTALILETMTIDNKIKMIFNNEVIKIKQENNEITVTSRDAHGNESEFAGAYLIAADGGHSAIRTMLGVTFDGAEYPHKVLRVMTDDAMETWLPGLAPLTYVFAGVHSMSLLRMPDCWRLILRVPAETGDETALAPDWIAARLRDVLPTDGTLPRLIHRDVYGASKRVAARYRVGRVLLAGDAAHLTNTRGGMNMNCGIHDAYSLAEVLARTLSDGDERRLDDWATARRRVATGMLIPRTDRSVAGGPGFLESIRAVAADKRAARDYLVTAAMLDMTTHDISKLR
jgi:2-polyprenyl-6-methoxyphenol hydroxylase-like FAD-dependent oxidoreductase